MARYELRGPDGARYEVQAPDSASEDEVLERFTREVGQAKEPVTGADRSLRRTVGKFSEGLLNYPLDAFTAGVRSATGGGSFGEEYKEQRRKTRQALSGGQGLNPTDVATDTAAYTGQAFASAPLAIARTGKEAVKEAARFGGVFGAAGGYSSSREDAGAAETAGNVLTHGATGGVLGAGLQKGINLFGDYVAKPISNALASFQRQRAEKANQIADDFAAGRVPEFAPALSDSGTVRGTAEELAGTIVGGPIRSGARQSIEAVERGVADELAAAGARTPAEAGQETQDFLRRQLTERSIPGSEIEAMTPQQLQDISGVRPSPEYQPKPPRVNPEQPRQIEPISPEQHLLEVEAGVPAIPPRATLDVESRYKAPTVEDVELSPDLVKKVQQSSAAVADLQRRVQAERSTMQAIEEPLVQGMDALGFSRVSWSPDVKAYVAQRRDGSYLLVGHTGAIKQGQATPEEAELLKRMTEWLGNQPKFQKGIADRQAQLDQAAIERDIVQREAAAYRTEQLPVLAEQRRAQAMQEAQGAAEAEAALATQRARAEAKERAAPTAVQDALQRTEQAKAQELQRVTQSNLDRQRAADEAFQADLAARQSRPIEPFQAGRAPGQTYVTEFDAAYQASRAAAPKVQRNPLGRRGTGERPEETTAVSQLLSDIATEARGGGQLPGFKGPIFDAKGGLRQDVIEYLEPRLGKDITDRLRYFSERREKNQFTPGLQGLLDIRTAMRRAADDVRRGSGHPGNTRSEDDAMLTRLKGAIDADIRRFAEEAGPAGKAFVQQRDAIDRAYEQYINDIRKPLADLFDKMDSVQAINTLVKDTQARGNIDRLKAFFKVVDDKGDRLSATAALLSKMADGDMANFLKMWRGLSEDAKQVMFRGTAKPLGDQLEVLARVGGRLEQFAKVAADDAKISISPGNLGLGLTYFLGVPALISTAIGGAAASKLLASKWFAGWLKRFPVEKGPGSPEAAAHVARLRAYAIEQLGITQAVADSILPEAKAMPKPGKPDGDAQDGPRKTLFTGERAETADQESLARARDMAKQKAEPEEIWKATGWFKSKDGKWRSEIDDSKANIRPLPGMDKLKRLETRETRLGKVLDHPDLFAAYPRLADLPVHIVNASQFDRDDNGKLKDGDYHAFVETDGSAMYMSGVLSPRAMRKMVLHEVQHLLETAEDFDYGDFEAIYERRAGEVEARNVENRADMNAIQRRERYPPGTQDVSPMRMLWSGKVIERARKESRDDR